MESVNMSTLQWVANITLDALGDQIRFFRDNASDIPALTTNSVDDILCPSVVKRYLPSIEEYHEAFGGSAIALIVIAGIALLLTCILYFDTVKYVITYSPAPVKTPTVLVISVYPLVSLMSFSGVLVPRSQLVSETVVQFVFMVSIYQFFCLCVAYLGGAGRLVEKLGPGPLRTRTLPCCCWPCCTCLPQPIITKDLLRLLRGLVLQLPIVQGILYLVQLIAWAEDHSWFFQKLYGLFQPALVISILLGVWGVIMTLTVCDKPLENFQFRPKFIILQLVLLLSKIQGLSLRLAAANGGFVCSPPITPSFYGNLILNALLLGEMVILSIFSRTLYKKDISKCVAITKSQFILLGQDEDSARETPEPIVIQNGTTKPELV